MLLDLSELVIREGMRVSLDVEQPGVEDPDLVFAAPLRGRVTFSNGGDVVNIQGEVNTQLTYPCGRCLVEVNVPLQVPIEEHFPIEEILHPKRQPTPGEEYDTTVSSVVYLEQGRPILDLDELLRQLIVTEAPIRPLCDEECAGLCPHCGVNRNETPCSCGVEEVNTPLSRLAVLLQEPDEESGDN